MIFMIPKGNNKMDKICEFCAALKPVVYCKADAAFLCLSCDAKVHSANSLSNRHLRTLLCDSCRNHPAYARCLDHRMFVCSTCDHSIHVRSSPHQKRILSSYTGCPSAKDFAALWGFAFDEFDKIAGQLQLFSAPRTTSAQPSKATFEFPIETHLSIGSTSRTSKLNYSTLVSGAQTEEGFGSKQTEKLYKGQKQQNIGFILQQILDLKKLQLTEVDNSSSPLMSSLEETDVSSSVFKNSKKYDDSVNHAQQDPDNAECLLRDSLPLSFAQSEDSPLPTTAANPLVGESFCDQLWSQNMQDLGVCEDILCHDDFNIPDVDITFRNFEELFGTEQDPIRGLLDEKNASFSSVEKDMSLDTSHNRNAGKRVDPSVASAVYVSQPVCMNEDTSPSNQTFAFPGSLDYHQTIEPSYSTMSFSMSRFSADGGGIGCLDSGLSPFITGAEGSYHSSDLEGLHSEAKDVTMKRYKEKKNRMKEKQTWYAPRKAGIDVRKRVKGRLAKTEEYDSDSIDITRSY